ncbi:hypothetical protein LMH87_003410 [Akanthomyces muscarius]|uniref:Uncharacterized protein n=1 Tax=Akanthomyces muscarius TaxID=2231603 RepID=A0A9W8Q1W1_AKAMU|nr:hypothetical protein LMH87_003410 [Akanthomyces muscarius]KAJ4144529.1 hypothetical protein LMH87_003410 [Akanthomyces muscarius]
MHWRTIYADFWSKLAKLQNALFQSRATLLITRVCVCVCVCSSPFYSERPTPNKRGAELADTLQGPGWLI